MITERRRQIILNQLQQKNIVTVHDLVNLTGASESTIRRDLYELEDQKLLSRIHGGAKKINSSLLAEPKVALRATMALPEKRAIAKAAANLVHDHEVIFLDSGTTTNAMIPFLAHKKDLLVLTNSVDNAALLADQQLHTIMLGGFLRSSTKATVGQHVTQYLSDCHLDQAFLGTNGFDVQHGFTTPDPEESLVKQAAVRQSDQTYVLADNSKYQQTRFSKFAKLDEAILITDHLTADISQHLTSYTKIMEVLQ